MDSSSPLQITPSATGGVTVLDVGGVLDGSTYLTMRNAVIKATVEEPAAVIVDVSALVVPAPSAWVVFLSAHWHVNAWRVVPIMLVCSDAAHREAMYRIGLHRHLAIHSATAAALAAATDGLQSDRVLRHRATVDLLPVAASVRQAQQFVAERLTAWSRRPDVLAARVVTAVLVDNAVRYTHGRVIVRVETGSDTVTIAVTDSSTALAAVRDVSHARGGLSGLEIMSALCRGWGNAPTDHGKTVWAVIGFENQL